MSERKAIGDGGSQGQAIGRLENPMEIPPAPPEWYQEVPRSGRGPTMFGFAILIFGVMGFGGWAATAPIEGAVVSSGVFVATTKNRIVQHLEGGVISDILVEEGELVREGQSLMRLDETQIAADMRRLRLREAQLEATLARLQAEAETLDAVHFPEHLRRSDLDAEIAAAVATQDAIFEARNQKLTTELMILDKSIASFEHRLTGDLARLKGAKARHDILSEEMAAKKTLYDKGLTRAPEYFAVRRAVVEVESEIATIEARIEDSKERLAGAKGERQGARDVAVQRATERIYEASAELDDIRQRMKAQSSIAERLEIRSPVEGIVVRMNYHTSGGVIRPGADIMAIVPSGDKLVIEARIRPQDIDALADGQTANVRLSALSQRTTPMMEGHVIYVSGDALPDDQRGRPTGDNVYIVRVQLDDSVAEELPHFQPTPGMPAELYIKTGDRTFFQYLMQPLIDTMQRAFREE